MFNLFIEVLNDWVFYIFQSVSFLYLVDNFYFLTFDYWWGLNSLIFVLILFFVGMLGALFNKKNILIFLLMVEVMFSGVILYYFYISKTAGLMNGYIYGLHTLILAASDSVIGLTLCVILYRVKMNINFGSLNKLSG